MADMTHIEWSDATWNPVIGCSRVSAGCGDGTGGGCYAEKMAHRLGSNPATPQYEGLTRMTASGPRWTGEVRLVEEHLEDPLRWKKPRRVFVNSMSDLFHETLPEADIRRIFDVMLHVKGRHHTYQILTKRPARMLEVLGRDWWVGMGRDWQRHIWLGVSLEDQQRADERIPKLLQCPAAVRFLSVEPLLGPVDLDGYLLPKEDLGPVLVQPIHWIIIGGESGPGARPMDLAWARAIVEQCRAADVPCFVKQLGQRVLCSELDLGRWPAGIKGYLEADGEACGVLLHDKKGGDITEFPADMRVREFPEVNHA